MNAADATGDYLAAIVAGDPRVARATVERLIATGTAARRVELEVLAPAMTAIGRLWEEARISVAQEHLATAITGSQLAWLAPRLAAPPPVGRTAILAGMPGELHVLGLQMVADFLTGDGWEILDLGQAVPTDDLVDFVAARRPTAVGLSSALTTRLAAARSAIARLRALPDPPLVMVGGAAYAGDEALARRLGADLFAADAGAASELLRAHFDART